MEKIIEYFKSSGETLNENKYFIGLSMILLNIGARFIIDELGDDLRQVISSDMVRKVFIFCAFFMATRDIFISIILTIVFIIIINEFLGTEETDGVEKDRGSSYKGELEKTIQQLKNVQMNI